MKAIKGTALCTLWRLYGRLIRAGTMASITTQRPIERDRSPPDWFALLSCPGRLIADQISTGGSERHLNYVNTTNCYRAIEQGESSHDMQAGSYHSSEVSP